MKKLTYIIIVLLICAHVFCACSPESGDDDKSGEAEVPAASQGSEDEQDEDDEGGESIRVLEVPVIEGEKETAGNITVFVPEGYSARSGNPDGSRNDDSVFIMSGEDFQSDYLWVEWQTMGNIQSSVESNSSEAIEPFSINGVIWRGKERAFYAQLGGGFCIVMLSPGLSYNSEPVLAAVGSLCD